MLKQNRRFRMEALAYPHMTNSMIIVFFTITFILLSFSKFIRLSPIWKATVTPLASIIGSGFLIVTPLLVLLVGQYAIFAIIGMVLLGYLIGYVMRFNIYHVEPLVRKSSHKTVVLPLERFSFLVLGIAYIISVPFYIKLLSLFFLRGFQVKSEIIANIISTALLAFIGIIGKFKGFKRLESMEEYAVNIKLSIIFSMIIGLIIYNMNLFEAQQWQLNMNMPIFNKDTLPKLLGALIIVQGFETSRFIGLVYRPQVRVKTMRYAQLLSGFIYIVFVALSLVIFGSIKTVSETAIIDISEKVAFVLPYLLILMAILSQFSAAIADTIGAGGLFSEATSRRLKASNSYVFIAIIAISLVWLTNIFQIITLASRAFALYYAIQSLESSIIAYHQKQGWRSALRMVFFSLMFIVLSGIVIFGVPV